MRAMPNEIIQPLNAKTPILRVHSCPVCGRKIGRDFAIPYDGFKPRQDFTRSNEACDACWAWSIRFDS